MTLFELKFVTLRFYLRGGEFGFNFSPLDSIHLISVTNFSYILPPQKYIVQLIET